MGNTDKRKNIWITTPDNPFSPFTQFDDWYDWDMKMGYDICGKIAKEAPLSEENLSEMENTELLNEAINLVLDKYEESLGFRICFEEEVKTETSH